MKCDVFVEVFVSYMNIELSIFTQLHGVFLVTNVVVYPSWLRWLASSVLVNL